MTTKISTIGKRPAIAEVLAGEVPVVGVREVAGPVAAGVIAAAGPIGTLSACASVATRRASIVLPAAVRSRMVSVKRRACSSLESPANRVLANAVAAVGLIS